MLRISGGPGRGVTMKALAVLAVLNASLAHRMGDRSYRHRDAAHRALAAMGDASLPFLERNQGHQCPEVRERVARLLYPYAVKLADRDSRKLATFRLPMFHVWDAKSGWVWDVRFHEFYATGYNLKESLRLWIRSQLLQRRPRAEIIGNLERMRAWGEGDGR